MPKDFQAAREATLARLIELATEDARIRALWLQGSLATGASDAFSDIDAYVAASDVDLDSLWAEREALLGRVGRVLVWADAASPALKAVHALMDDGARLDLFFERAAAVGEPKRPAVKVVLDKDGIAERLATGWTAPTAQLARTLTTIIRFTRQGAVWPLRLLGRGQWSSLAMVQLELINDQLVQLMAVRRDPAYFYKHRLSQLLLLSAEDRADVEALTADALAASASRDLAALKDVQLRIGDRLVAEGRAACAALGVAYPIAEAEERAVRELMERAWPP